MVRARRIGSAGGGQTELQEVHVATRVLPPMVVQQGDALTGFSIDLWNAISEGLVRNC